MSYGREVCYANCPASTVTIQPPPFVLTIPGPALYCPDQPFQIQQHNPCATGGLGGGLRSEALYGATPSLSRFSSFYTQGPLSCNSDGCFYKPY